MLAISQCHRTRGSLNTRDTLAASHEQVPERRLTDQVVRPGLHRLKVALGASGEVVIRRQEEPGGVAQAFLTYRDLASELSRPQPRTTNRGQAIAQPTVDVR
jgi:hypothetical protein